MAKAKVSWKFTLKDGPTVFTEQGKTFEEAAAQMPPEWVLCVQGQEWEKYAWPGGYPLYYVTKDGGCLCSKCANDNLELTLGDDPQWKITLVDINYEDTSLYCDNCQKLVESAYGEDDGTSDD